jgi:hypothetical protein
MREVDDGNAAEPRPDSPAPAGRRRRRKQAVAGAVGLATILGGGAIALEWAHEGSGSGTTTSVTGTSEGVAGSGPASGSAAEKAGGVQPGSGKSPSTAASSATRRRTDAERIEALRGKAAQAARDGTQVRTPLPNVLSGRLRSAVKGLRTVKSGSMPEKGWTMKVVSARQDLTGYRELAWVADKGEKVGNAHCTQKIRLASNVQPKVRPTLLLCWRTSEKKSVYTVLVDTRKAPSTARSIAAIDSAWAKLD